MPLQSSDAKSNNGKSKECIEQIEEYVDNRGVKPVVENGILRGVKILGFESLNGRTYLPDGVRRAIPLYEGAKTNVNHANGNGPRDYRDRMGIIRGVVLREGEGLFGDYHFNPKHELAEQLKWDAENAPENVGFSHVVEAKTSRRDGKMVVEEIKSVRSVDLVADPATTHGLFESAEEQLPDVPGLQELAEESLSAIDLARSVLFAKNETLERKKTRLAEVLATWQAELGEGTTKNTEGSDVELKELTVEQLKAERPDLVEVLTGTDAMSKLTAQVATLTAERDALKLKESTAAKASAIAEELKAAKLAPKDANDKLTISESFMAQLNAAPDAAARSVLIAERVALTKATATKTVATPPMAPLTESATTGAQPSLQDTLALLQ